MGFKGYVASQPFQGHRVPQHVQNLVIRDYCATRHLTYLLSGTEYAIPGSFLILQQILDDLHSLEGIVCYSLFQLPASVEARKLIYDQVLDQSKSIHFAVESLSMASRQECQRVEDIWTVFRMLGDVPNLDEIL